MALFFSSVQTSGIERKSLKQPDKLTQVVGGLFQELGKRTSLLIIGLVALVIGCVLGGLYLNYSDSRSNQANGALYLATQKLEEENKKLRSVNSSTPSSTQAGSEGSELFKKVDVDQSYPGTISQLSAVEKNFSGTRAAFESRLKLGDLYFNHGDFTKALSWYNRAVDTAPSKFEKTLALSALGYANENLGKPNEALQAFQKAVNMGETSLKGDLLLGLARNHEALHDTAKARNTYEQIIVEFPNSDYAKNAETFKNMLR